MIEIDVVINCGAVVKVQNETDEFAIRQCQRVQDHSVQVAFASVPEKKNVAHGTHTLVLDRGSLQSWPMGGK